MNTYGNFTYSIDKIKFRGKLCTQKHKWIPHLSKIRSWCNFLHSSGIELVSENESMLPFRYRYSFTLRLKGQSEGSFYIAEWYNGDFQCSKQKPNNFLIEYNPNKSGSLIFNEFCETFIFRITEIVSFDLAYDLPNYNANDVYLDTICDVMTYGKSFNKTLYVAPKEDRSGRVKVYSKHMERAVHDVQMSETLRIEVSVKSRGLDLSKIYLYGDTLQELTKVVNHLNSVKIKRKDVTSDDWKLYALSCLTPEQFTKCLSLIKSPNARSKYRKLLSEDTYFSLDLDTMTLAKHISDVLQPWNERIKI